MEAPDPRIEVHNVYWYLRSRWAQAVVRGEKMRARKLRIAFDAIATEWPEEVTKDEEE